MLIIIDTAGSREKNIVSGITPAVNNNPTTTNTAFNAPSRTMLTSLWSPQLLHGSASSYCTFAYPPFACFRARIRQACADFEMAGGVPHVRLQTCEPCRASP